MEALRAVKEPTRSPRIRARPPAAERRYERLAEGGLVGRTEREVALASSSGDARGGRRGPSFDSIVAAGPHGALPHADPARRRDRRAARWSSIESGAVLDGYCSDCTRTFAAGDARRRDAPSVYEIVLEAQIAGLEAVRPGAGGARGRRGRAQGDRRRRASASASATASGMASGWRSTRGRGCPQRLRRRLEAGNIVTVEPGIYLPGEFGVRIEDLVAVTGDGCEILTGFTKELLVVD